MDLALVQFHNLCYGSMAKAYAKYFQDSTVLIFCPKPTLSQKYTIKLIST